MKAKTKYEERPWLKFYFKEVPPDIDIPEQSVVETFDETTDRWKDKTALIFYHITQQFQCPCFIPQPS